MRAKEKAQLIPAGLGKSFWMRWLFAIVADGFDRAAFFGFLAKRLFFRSGRLLVNIRIPAVVISGEIIRSGLAAKVAIDALIIDVILTGGVLWVSVRNVGHKIRLPKPFGNLGPGIQISSIICGKLWRCFQSPANLCWLGET